MLNRLIAKGIRTRITSLVPYSLGNFSSDHKWDEYETKDKQSLYDRMPKHKVLLNPSSYRMAHPVYSQKTTEAIKVTH